MFVLLICDCLFVDAVMSTVSSPSMTQAAAMADPDAEVAADAAVVTLNGVTQRPANYRHVVVESEHPYMPATKSKWELQFADDVTWLVVEFDPRCRTAQPEDRVSLYFDAALRNKVRCPFS